MMSLSIERVHLGDDFGWLPRLGTPALAVDQLRNRRRRPVGAIVSFFNLAGPSSRSAC